MRRLALVLFTVFVAVGVVGVAAGVPEARTRPASYSQVVGNTTEGRFEADEGWGASSYGRGVHDENYRFARPAEEPSVARFKVEIPESGEYAVYASWPKVEGLNDSAPVGVMTTSGLEWEEVDQQQDGGKWVRVGIYEMEAGDDYSVMFSRETSGEGYVIADAVRVERVSSSRSSSRRPSRSEGDSGRGSNRERASAASSAEGQAVLREARKWLGTPYRLGGVSRSGVDCSSFTMLVYRKAGISLPHSDARQFRYGSRVSGPPQPGDLVFFDEHDDDDISHVGIYAGNGRVIHASDYFDEVTESEMKNIKGYAGARRLL